MRIALGGIGHETNTFSTLRTTYEDFRVRRGDEITADASWGALGGADVTWAPTLIASASPHGPVTEDAYTALRDDLLARLRAATPVDGVYLALHGAMEVEGIGDGESDLLRSVREVVGDEPLIAASFDLHGNVAPAVVDALNIITALRTAPHRDGEETRRRALNHLIRCLREGIRPVCEMVKPPLLLPGEYAITEVEPAASLYGRLPGIEARPGIVDASLFIGCAWTDGPHTSPAAIVVAESDRAIARAYAMELAEAVWERRDAFGPDVETLPAEAAIEAALSAHEPTVFISDSGDNVTAGGGGDNPDIARRLIAAGARGAVVAGIADPEAVCACGRAGVGSTASLSIGGKLDAVNGTPLVVDGVVTHLDNASAPEVATVRVGGVEIVLATDRRAFATLGAFTAAGIDPLERKVVVVKLGSLFPQLRDNAPRAIMALTPGFTDLRMASLPFERVPRPIYPLDCDFAWSPA